MEITSTTEVAKQEKCDSSTARKWAAKNGVLYIGKDYLWTQDDIARFKKRPKPGRRWSTKKTKKKK